MRRLKDTWKDVCDINNGVCAVIEGTRFKRGNREVRKLLSDNDYHQIDCDKAKAYAEPLIESLKNKTWRHKKPRHRKEFCRNTSKKKGKWRDLYIPALPDHTIAHMVMSANMKAFTRGMYPHCCGSVPGRGIKHILKNVSWWFQHDRQCRYFVKLDIRKFFDHIDRDILLRKLSEKIKDKNSLWIFEQIIDSAPVACPVGYYTSPWFANLYLEDLDWFIVQNLYKERRGKRINYVRHYLRYMDDMLLVGTSKADLKKAVRAIMDFIAPLNLELKPTWEIKAIGRHEGKHLQPGTCWCDIGGYKFCKDCVVLRDGIYLSFRKLAKGIYKQGFSPHRCKSIMSRIGWARHANSNGLIENEIKPYVNIKSVRRYISNVDKVTKRRINQAAQKGRIREHGDCAKELPARCSIGRYAGTLDI